MQPAQVSLVRIVTDFYARVLASPELAPFFDGVSMETLIKHQTAFINAIGGSSSTHTDEQLALVHTQLAISDANFDLLIGLLSETLAWYGIRGGDAEVIIEHFEKRRELVVTSG